MLLGLTRAELMSAVLTSIDRRSCIRLCHASPVTLHLSQIFPLSGPGFGISRSLQIFLGEEIVDFSVTRDRRGLVSRTVHANTVIPALPQKLEHHAVGDDGSDRSVSRDRGEGLANNGLAAKRFFGQRPVRLKH